MTETTLCRVLRAFPLSLDGFTVSNLAVGDDAEVPKDMLEGLFLEGFVTHPDPEAAAVLEAARAVHLGLVTPAVISPAIETGDPAPADLDAPEKDPVTETKAEDPDDIEALRTQYEAVSGEAADKRWSADTLRQKIIEA